MKPMSLIPAAAVLGLALSSPAAGAIFTSHLASDQELLDLVPEEHLAFVAEGRVGDLGGYATFELDLGQSTAAPDTTAQHAWQSGLAEAFVLSYDHASGVVSFALGGKTLFYTPVRDFTEIFIRTRAVNDSTLVRVFDLVLNGEAVDDVSAATGPNGLDILRIQGPELSEGFTLTGKATLTWWAAPPTQSRLAFQIKLARPDPEVSTQKTTWGRIKSFFQERGE